MPTIELSGRNFEVDEDGFLQDPGLWNKEVAQLFAEADGIIELSEKHWSVINYIREYWLDHDMAPLIRNVCDYAGLSLREIYELFPSGPSKGACKIAGLPRPDGCV